MRKLASVILIIAVTGWVASWSSPKEKMMKFFEKGRHLYAQGDLAGACMEFKNAVQIAPTFAWGYYYLGLVERRESDYRKAFGYFSKAAQLDNSLLEAQVELGRMYLEAKVMDKALERVDRVLAVAPDHVPAGCLKAAVLLQQGKAEKAAVLLNGLMDDGARSADIYLLMALAAIQRKDQGMARKDLRKGIAAYPDSIELFALLADIESRSGRYAEAEKALKRIISLEPMNLDNFLKLADLFWETDRQPRANRMLREMIARDSKNEERRLQAARFFLGHADTQKAEQLLKESIAVLPGSFKLRFALSELYFKDTRADAACKVMEACLMTMGKELDGADIVQAKNLLAMARLAKGEVAAAETLINEVIRDRPRNVDAHFLKGKLYLLQQQAGEAVSEFQTVVTERPEFVEAHLYLAEAYLLKKDDALSLDCLLSASKAMPGSKTLHLGLARIYIRQKNYAAAEEQFNLILKSNPRDYSAAASLGDLFSSTGQPGRAEAQYRKICRQAPDNETGYLKLSRFYTARNQPDEAVAVLTGALERNPGSRRLLSGLVEVYVRTRQADKAVAVCRRCLDKAPGQAWVYNLMGKVYLSQKDFPDAEKALNKATELEPSWPVPYGNLARVYLAQGRTDTAIDNFKSALAANPRSLAAYLALSKLYEQKEAYLAAIEVYERALAVYPYMWAAANNVAFLLCENARKPGDLARAEIWGQRAADLHPNDPMVQDTMAWIAFKQGNPDQAQRVMEKAMTKAPEEPALNYHMGVILAESGKVIEARERLIAALANGSRFPGRIAAEALLAQLNEKWFQNLPSGPIPVLDRGVQPSKY